MIEVKWIKPKNKFPAIGKNILTILMVSKPTLLYGLLCWKPIESKELYIFRSELVGDYIFDDRFIYYCNIHKYLSLKDDINKHIIEYYLSNVSISERVEKYISIPLDVKIRNIL